MNNATSSRSDYFATQVVIGWVALVLVQLASLVCTIAFSAFDSNNFVALFDDPGPAALRVIRYVVFFMVLIPIYVSVFARTTIRPMRWLPFVLAICAFFWSVMHHLSHLLHGDVPTLSSNMSLFTEHAVELWLLWSCLCWARSTPSVQQ